MEDASSSVDVTARSGYSALDNSKDAFTNLSNYNYSDMAEEIGKLSGNNYKGIMEYEGKAFAVGNTKAFSNVIETFFDTSNIEIKKVKDYLNLMDEQIKKIKACMEQDRQALETAKSEWIKIMNNPEAYRVEITEWSDEQMCNVTTSYIDRERQRNDADAKREAVWIELRCDLWDK